MSKPEEHILEKHNSKWKIEHILCNHNMIRRSLTVFLNLLALIVIVGFSLHQEIN